MAKAFLGDIPGARFHEPMLFTVAAIASGGANSNLGYFGPFAHDIRVRNVWFTPTSASIVATQTATYRQIALYNAGTSGTASATGSRLAFLNASATAASWAPAAFTIVDATGTSETVASGTLMYFSQSTVGGTDANGTVLPGGHLALAYEVV